MPCISLEQGCSLRDFLEKTLPPPPLTYHSEWETDPPTSPLKPILSQPFYYLGKGSQCYAFVSADDRYILKFFRQNRYRIPFTENPPYPSFLKEIHLKRYVGKIEKKKRLFESCLLADTYLKEETGLIYLHLNPSSHLKQKITLQDKLQRTYCIDLDHYQFLIQEKGDLSLHHLSQLIETGNKEGAKKAIDSLCSLLKKRYLKGIGDEDPGMNKNMGFHQGEARFFDVGAFYPNQELKKSNVAHLDAEKTSAKTRQWIKEKDPELAAYFESKLP